MQSLAQGGTAKITVRVDQTQLSDKMGHPVYHHSRVDQTQLSDKMVHPVNHLKFIVQTSYLSHILYTFHTFLILLVHGSVDE